MAEQASKRDTWDGGTAKLHVVRMRGAVDSSGGVNEGEVDGSGVDGSEVDDSEVDDSEVNDGEVDDSGAVDDDGVNGSGVDDGGEVEGSGKGFTKVVRLRVVLWLTTAIIKLAIVSHHHQTA